MTLEENINSEIKKAMLAKDQRRLEALRGIKSELLLLKTSEKGSSEEAEMKVLQKMVKQRKEAAEIYKTGNRPELEETELFQASVIESFLPKQMSMEELENELKTIIVSSGATSKADMGKVMGIATKQLAGKAEGKAISEIVRKLLVVMLAVVFGCNNSQLEQQYKQLHEHDSMMFRQNQQYDSTVSDYVRTFNQIQDNIDSIKSKERILAVNNGEQSKGSSIINDIKSIDAMIISNTKRIYNLQSKLKKMSKKDADMERMVAHLTQEVAERNNELADLQAKYNKTNQSLQEISSQFNDSIAVLTNAKTQISNLTAAMHTVYYAIGTMKELVKEGVVNKNGGFIGIGKIAELKSNFNSSYFTRADMTDLKTLVLNAKFKSLVSQHPGNSYQVSTTGDTLMITDPAAFWSQTKYLVVAVK